MGEFELKVYLAPDETRSQLHHLHRQAASAIVASTAAASNSSKMPSLFVFPSILKQAIEFVQFRERLQHSHQYSMIRIEGPILQLKQKAASLEEAECILENLNHGLQLLDLSSEDNCKSLMFNEDMQSRPWWTPTPDENYLLGPFEEDLLCPEEFMGKKNANERETRLRKVIERRALLPRLVSLSIQTASSSLKENVKANGSIHDNSNSSELKHLLERYARNLGNSFDGAIKIIVGILEGQRHLEDCSSHIVDWMNYAVFMNAWNLFSRDLALPDGNGCQFDSWNLVDNLIEKCTIELLRSTGPLLKCPGHDLLSLVQMVTETFSWHCLVIQSCLRSLQPSGKKKKRGSGAADHSHLPLCKAIRHSVDSLCAAVEKVTTWLKVQLNELEDEKLSFLLSSLQRNECDEGPGHILEILQAEAGTPHPEVGFRISQMLQSWSSADVARKVIKGQCSVLSEFYCLCNSKLKSIQALRQLIP